MTPILSLMLMAMGSLGLFFGTANNILHVPFAILLYPAALYIAALRSSSPFRLGWLIGVPGAAAALYWIAVAAHLYGGFPWLLAAPCSILLGIYVSLWGGLFSWLVSRQREFGPLRRCAAAGLLWFLLEWMRGWFGTGFSWLTLSSGLAAWPLLLQPLSLLGEYGWSGMLVSMACLLCEHMLALGAGTKGEPLRRAARCLAVFAALACGFGAFSAWRMAVLPEKLAAEGVPVTISMVQGNIRQDMKWSAENQRSTLEKYASLSLGALREGVEAQLSRPVREARELAASIGLPVGSPGDISLEPAVPDMLLWPETAMPFAYPLSPLSAELRTFVRDAGLPLVFGAPGFERRPGGERPLFNRAFFLSSDGPAAHYSKEHLVPFGEYLPPVLDWKLFEPLLQGLGGFEAGLDDPLFVLKPKGRPAVPMGMLICYEAIFPELAHERTVEGAQLLLNISNDAWYDRTSAPMQHLQLALMRSVEQCRYTARATNSGVTAFLDPLGGVHAMGSADDGFALFQDGHLTGTVLALDVHTPYFYLEPWLAPLALVLAAALCFPAIRRTKRKKTV